MRRHFYICNNLDELEIVEKELENNGISTPHIHVLSLDDGEVARHSRLHEVEAVLRTDVVHGTEVGALIGVLASATILLVAKLLQQCQNVLGLCVGLCQYRDTRLLEDLGTGQVSRFLSKVSILNT